MIAHQWQDVQSQPPSALPAWSREEFRVSAQIATEASRVGKEVLSLPFSHKEVLPFTSPYLTEWELLGKRWRALPEAERLQYKVTKGAPSERTIGSPILPHQLPFHQAKAPRPLCRSCWICVRSLCLRPQRAQRLALRRSCSCRSSWRRALESMTEEEAIEVMLT